VLEGVELEVAQGEMVAVVGESGSGKTTLLSLLAGLDHPSTGEVLFDDTNIAAFSDNELAEHRNRRIGFVWQLSNLLVDFTALENVALPLLARGEGRDAAFEQAVGWLQEVGLEDRAGHLAGELSGGEQQRIAPARALEGKPDILFADEPTGNLDEATGGKIFALLQQLHCTHGLTSVIATHNLELAGRCDRVWRLGHGGLAA
jgi:lipoprotein-releasing system ATP-binding protein